MLSFKKCAIGLLSAMVFATPAHGEVIRFPSNPMSIARYVAIVKTATKKEIEKITDCDSRFVGAARGMQITKCSRFASAREAAMNYFNIASSKNPKNAVKIKIEIVSLFENLVKSGDSELTKENLVSVGKICENYPDVQFCLASFNTNAEEVMIASVRPADGGGSEVTIQNLPMSSDDEVSVDTSNQTGATTELLY